MTTTTKSVVASLIVVDLFAGAGGGTTSFLRAAEKIGLPVQIIAVNHWQTAVDTHQLNHPNHVHYCDPVEAVHPRIAVPGGKIFALIAGPSCVHFSRARGGEPKDDQQRAGAWQVFKWAQELNPEIILVENVTDFLTWGPLDSAGRPIKDGLGAEFLRWVGALEKLGYRVEWRILCAADYGDPTTRKRLFIQATRGRIKWPLPSHCDPKIINSFPSRQPWRTAEEIINYTLPSQSIFDRKKPLVEATVCRIHAGVEKFWGPEFAYDLDTPGPHPWKDRPLELTARRILKLYEMGCLPFMMKFHGGENSDRRTLPITAPMATLDTSNRFGLLEPYLVKYYGGHTADSVRQPIGTLTASYEHYGLAQGFLVGVGGPRSLHREISLQVPLRSQLSQNHMALVQPYICNMEHGADASGFARRSISGRRPIPTITGTGAIACILPFLIPFFGERAGQSPRCQSISGPLATVTGQGAGAMIQPYIISLRGTGENMARPKQISEPVVTLTAGNHEYLVQPFLFSYYGHGSEFSLAGPMPTATGRDRFALVHGAITYSESYPRWALDIHLRMLDPEELKLAHSFGPDYQFCGTRADQVKQIGNSWPCGMGEALSRAILEGVASGHN